MSNLSNKSQHDLNVIAHYGGEEFDMRMEVFPDGYHNLGYWKDSNGVQKNASRALFWEAIKWLKLQENDIVLEIGCGVGKGIIDLYSKNCCKKIVGIDITPENIIYAKKLAEDNSIANKVSFHQMSATDIRLDKASFNKIFSVDCAVHFNTREKFFSEAYMALKSDSLLVILDTCISKKILKHPFKIFCTPFLKSWCVPEENVYDLNEYKNLLVKAGFEHVEASSIGCYTLLPACNYFISPKHWTNSVRVEGLKETLVSLIVFTVMKFAYKLKLLDYGLFVCSKGV